MRDSKLSWDLRTNRIYSIPKTSSAIFNNYVEENKVVELHIEKSYFLGTNEHKTFIEENFFNELVSKKVCTFKKLIVDKNYGGYVCDSKSKIFLDSYNNKFPALIFKNNYFIDELILNEKDLFFYNEYDKSDTNIYFIIYFNIYNTKWMLGRTFYEKYRFSFDIDNGQLLYHKKRFNIDNKRENDNSNNNQKDSKFLKVLFIIFLIVIIFALGVLFHKIMIKTPRKQKANELDDDFYYEDNDNKKIYNQSLDINSNNNNLFNKNNLMLELGAKNT